MTLTAVSSRKTIMAKHFIPFLLLIFTSTISFGQKVGDYYISIPSKGILNCRLRFVSDSTIELSSIPRHMELGIRRRLVMVFKYMKTDTTIEVLPGLLAKPDSLSLKDFGFIHFIKPVIILTKIDGGFIDYSESLIYVRDFRDKSYVLYYIINGKTYIESAGVTNKLLQKKLKRLNIDNCSIEIAKGLEAYKRYGIEKVHGAVVITTK
jgi:hypothetical protein